MPYVDPNFDTYMLDSCAQYGILSCDPCLYLTGKPSPYLQQYYPPTMPIPKDTYTPSTYQNPTVDSRGWKKWALGALATAVAVGFAIKHPNAAKKLIPKSIREFSVKKTPKCIKNFFSKSWEFINDTCAFAKKKFTELSKK